MLQADNERRDIRVFDSEWDSGLNGWLRGLGRKGKPFERARRKVEGPKTRMLRQPDYRTQIEEVGMKRLLAALGVAAIVFSLALPGAAQEVVSAKASRVTIGGYIDFDAVARQKDIFLLYDDRDEHFVNTDIAIDLTIDMTDNVSAFIRLRDNWVYDEFRDVGDTGLFDIDTIMGINLGTYGPQYPVHVWGNSWWDTDSWLAVEQAYIDVKEFLVPELDLRLGLQNLVWDLRGNGDEFVLNVNENHGYCPIDAGAWKATYDADPLVVEGFVATLFETLGYTKDKALYGALATYPFDDMSKGQLGVLVYNNDSVQLYIVDVGVDYWLNEDTEIYGEAAFNFGEALAAGPDVEFDANGWGGYAGGMYTFSEVEWTPSVDLSFWYLSGEGDSTPPFVDGDSDAFLTFEDVDTFAIIEENHYGWDIESNYWAVKACASAKPREDLTADLKVGWFQRTEKYEDVLGWEEENIGTEVDASLTWQYSENLSVTGAVAYLFGSDVLEEILLDVVGDPDLVGDSGYMASLSTMLVF